MENLVGVDIPEQYIGTISDVIKQKRIKDFSVSVSPASGKGENFMGLIYRLKVEGVTENGEETEFSLILKIPFQSTIMRERFPLSEIYTREVNVYNIILPELCALQEKFYVPESERFLHVKCFKADSKLLEELLLLEDMVERGFLLADRRKSLKIKHLKLALKSLASLHALSFVLKKQNPKRFLELVEYTGGISDYDEDYMYFFELSRERAIKAMENPLHIEKLQNYGIGMHKKLHYYLSPDTVEPYSVICHGDVWNNNLLFKIEEDEPVDVVLLDWQITRHCSPLTDLAYLFFSGTDYDLRKNHFQELLDYYHDCLAKSLSYMDCDIEEHFPKAVFEEHQKKILPYGLFMSFMLLPAVLGEAEDVPDMDALLAKEEILQSDLKFENKQASNRYQTRMRGVVQTCLDMDLI